MTDGLRFVIYDKTGAYARDLSKLEAEADLVVNAVSTASFTLDDDHSAIAAVMADGARCAVWFRGVERFRGRIEATPGTGPDGFITASIESDMRKFWDWEGWPDPANPIGSQTSSHRVYTGSTESVFKAAVGENLTRLGVSWTVVPAPGTPRGSLGQKVAFRFHPLADLLFPLLERDRLIVVLDYNDDYDVSVDLREPNTVAGVFTLASGVPDGYDFNRKAPKLTRAVVGGRGQDEDRELVQVIDTDREEDWGDIIEGFISADNTEEGADIALDGTMALAEAAPVVGVSTDLVETARFMYGTTYEIGDLLQLQLGPISVTEQITGVSITESAKDGVVVVPRIGLVESSADVEVELASALARLSRGVRDQERR